MKSAALILAAAVTAALSAQEQRPVFRSGTTLVPVTVTVTDQQGRPVTGLTQADFRIFEDGKPREVAAFFPQMLSPAPSADPPMAIVRDRQAGLVPATRRTFVLVLGYGRIQEPTKALDGAIKFVRERLLPQDAVAVMALHRTTAITTDHAAVTQVLARYRKEHERQVNDIREFFIRTRMPPPYGCGGPPLPADMLAGFDRDLFSGVLAPSAIRNTIDLLLGMDVGAATGEKPWQARETFNDMLKSVERACFNLSDVVILSSRIRLYAAIEYLRYLDGEKHVVVLSNSGIARTADHAKEIAARANDARVVVDFVSTSGMYLSRDARYSFAGCDPCRDVAERTGGLYSSVDSMDDALARVDRWSRSSYLLGYVPANPTLDGGYRQVRVEVNRPKVTVGHRNGYYASEGPAQIDVKDVVEEARSTAARRYDVDAQDIALEVEVKATVMPTKAAEGSLTAEVTVDMTSVALETTGGVRSGQLDVSIYAGDSKETVVGQTQVRWNLRADPETYAAWLRAGLTRTLSVPITAAPKYLKVVVYDRQSDRVGSKTVTIK